MSQKESIESKRSRLLKAFSQNNLSVQNQAITQQQRGSNIPASAEQARLWLQLAINGPSGNFHIPHVMEVSGLFDASVFAESLRQVAALHEVLRTTFAEQDGILRQVIHPTLELGVQHNRYQNAMTDAALASAIQQEILQPFDLQDGPLLRLTTHGLQSGQHLIVLTVHHLVADGWSLDLLLSQCWQRYQDLLQEKTPASASVPLQYADYAIWQGQILAADAYHKGLDYWAEKLQDVKPLELPFAAPRPALQSGKGDLHFFEIDTQLRVCAEQLAKRERTTLFTVLLAAFRLVLAELSGQDDFCIGTTAANRSRAGSEQIIGFFANLLALRTSVKGHETFASLLAQEQQTVAQALQRQEISFDHVVERLAPARDSSRSPLFQVNFVLQNTKDATAQGHDAAQPIPNLHVKRRDDLYRHAQYDLTLFAESLSGHLNCCLLFNADLFSATEITRLADTYQHYLTQLCAQPDAALLRIPRLSATANAQLQQWQFRPLATNAPASIGSVVAQLGAEQPQQIALSCGAQHLSYAELNQRANQLAAYIQNLGVALGSNIGICLDAGIEMIVSMLGILNAGCAFVPLDTQYANERLQFMIEDSGLSLVITDEQTLEQQEVLQDSFLNLLVLEEEQTEIAAQAGTLPTVHLSRQMAAYVMYTSGTTGQPKGVVISQEAILRLAYRPQYIQVSAEDVFLQFAPTAFDASTFEIWTALLNGARLIVPETQDGKLDKLGHMLLAEKVTVLWLTSGLFSAIAEQSPQVFAGLRYLLCGGDVLSVPHVRKVSQLMDHGVIVNGYGPTETTTFAASYTLAKGAPLGSSVPLGRPIQGTSIYVLNEQFEQLPLGAVGDIYIGGQGLAHGYINQAGLTANAFLPDPFSPVAGARMYCSGDKGMWQSDGQLCYLGRRDRQIKWNGYRIELAEIENAVMRCEGVGSAVADVAPGADKQLIVYWSQQPHLLNCPDEVALRNNLKKYLPAHIVPSRLCQVASMPLTANGKVDRAALRAIMPVNPVQIAQAQEMSQLELRLFSLWQATLGRQDFGAEDGFFDLGGDSLLAIKLKTKAQEQDIHFEIQDLFTHQTIRSLAQLIETTQLAESAPVGVGISQLDDLALPAGVVDAYPLSQLQLGMLYHSLRQLNSSLYHDVLGYLVSHPCRVELIEQALAHLSQRHSVLRTGLDMATYPKPTQLVYAMRVIPLQVTDLSTLDDSQQSEHIKQFMEQERFSSFDLSHAPLFRCFVFRLSDQRFKLIWSFHHAILDGWSEAALTIEFLQSYLALLAGHDLPFAPALTPYRHFIETEIASLQNDTHKLFWQNLLADVPVTSLKKKISSAQASAEQVGYVQLEIDASLEAALQDLARTASVPLKSVLLAAHLHALSALTGEKKVITATVMHVRPETSDADKIVGLFLNSLPFPADCSKLASPVAQVKQVFATEASIYQHRFYPAQQIHKEVPGLEIGEVLFNFTNFHVLREVDAANLDMLRSRDGHAVNNYPIQVDFSISADTQKLQCLISYQLDAFEPQDVADIGHMHKQALLQLCGKISQIQMPDAALQSLQQWARPSCDTEPAAFDDYLLKHATHQANLPAVIEGGQELTYAQLQQRVDAAVALLQKVGVKKGDTVIVAAQRSTATLISVYALFRMGLIYLPLDPTLPEKRLAFILNDSQASLVIGDADGAAHLRQLSIPFISVDQMIRSEMVLQQTPPEVASCDLAYILYTSGSTGEPKGVLCRQLGILALFKDLQHYYPLGQQDRILWKTAMTFDVSLTEMLWPIVAGATIVVAPKDSQYDARQLARIIADKRVTVVNFVQSMLHLFLQENQFPADFPLKAIFAAGESLLPVSVDLVQQVLPALQLWNAYGPTEASIYCTIWPVVSGNILIGKAVGDVGLHVLAADLSRLPIGMPGELYLSGQAVAVGYLNRPELSAERFIANPYGVGDPVLYRTGDRVRFDRNGNLEFLGRIDNQVKVRGFRIELGEIEAVLATHESVAKVAVAVRSQSGQASVLCAFVEARDNVQLSADQLKAFARHELPSYMVPDMVLCLPSLPTNSSGKIDRKQLLQLQFAAPSQKTNSLPRLNEMQAMVMQIWQDILERPVDDIDANFFDVGGNSLALIQCQSRLRAKTGHEIEIQHLFKYPTVRLLATFLSGTVETASGSGNIPATTVQLAAQSTTATHGNDVAIIGMSMSASGAHDVERLWSMLLAAEDGISRHDNQTLRKLGVPQALLDNPRFVAARGEMAEIDCFDAAFFGYTPREAEIMDPQLRKLLEESYRALEDAGYAQSERNLDIGTYVGIGASNYLLHHVLYNLQVVESLGHFQINLLNQPASQIAYRLNLTGPAVSVNTACSTSLVALHMACRAVLHGECQMALAGAASISVDGIPGYVYREGGILSADGYCRAFDVAANGTVEGAGAGVLVVKKYEHAVRDGDHIYAIIKGSAINNDGHDKIGYSAPSTQGQVRVIQSALAAANLPATSIHYIETHGTGTVLGDPIEIAALLQTYGQRDVQQPCYLGALKTTLGHLDSAAGVAGAIKAALVLQSGRLPATLHFEETHPRLGMQDSVFLINTETVELRSDKTPLRAAVSSFGIGGTNAHMILEAPPPAAHVESGVASHCLRLSAKTPQALQSAMLNLGRYLLRHPTLDIADVAYSLQVGRRDFAHRAYLLSDNLQNACEQLLGGQLAQYEAAQLEQPLIFMFTGQGGQKAGMGQVLYQENTAFHLALDQVCDLFQKHAGLPLKSMLFAPKLPSDTAGVQPLLFAFQYALYQTWQARGVRPDYLIGHSLGELTAACCAGVFTLEEAVQLLVVRANAMQSQAAGAMLAVSLPESELVMRMPKELSLAAVNGPLQSVVSGGAVAIEQFMNVLQQAGVTCSKMSASHAFHSPMMQDAATELAAFLDKLNPAAPRIPLISNLTGKLLTAEQACDPRYWCQQMLMPVRFSDGVKELAQLGDALWLEIGPRDVLAALVRSHRVAPAEHVLNSFNTKGAEGEKTLIVVQSKLWAYGAKMQSRHLYANEVRRRLPLPAYAFEKKRFWLPAITVPSTVSSIPLVAAESTAVAPTSIANNDGHVQSAPQLSTCEQQLVDIWKECLGYQEIALTDNFFAIGGDSLLSVRILARIRERMGIEVSIAAFLSKPTIAQLVAHIEDAEDASPAHSASNAPIALTSPSGTGPIVPVTAKREAKMSFQQQRLWTLERLGMGGRVFHLQESMELRGQVNPHSIEAAIQALLLQHPSLRTSFHVGQEEQDDYQCVHAAVSCQIERHTLQGLEAQAALVALKKIKEQQLATPFQLDQAPLFRVALVEFSASHFCLLMVFHHIVLDGWSYNLIAHDLAGFYRDIEGGHAAQVRPAGLDYADYSEQQQLRFATDQFAQLQAFWDQQLAQLPVMGLQTDYPRTGNASGIGRELPLVFDVAQAAAIDQFCVGMGTTPYVVFLSAFLLVLSRWSSEHDLVVGTPVANRPATELEGLVGFFVNMLVLRFDLEKVQDLQQLLALVKQNVLAAQSHQEYPFSKLVEQYAGPRDVGVSPLFQVMFSMQQEPTRDFSLGTVDISFQPCDQVEAEYELTLNLFRRGSGFAGVLQYRADLFASSTIEEIRAQFNAALKQMISSQQRPLSQICLLSEASFQQIIRDTNQAPQLPGNTGPGLHPKLAHSAALAVMANDGRQWRYSDLQREIDMCSQVLHQQGISAGMRIAVDVQDAFSGLQIMFAIWQLGAVYVPLSLQSPSVERMLIMSEAMWLICEQAVPFAAKVKTLQLASLKQELASFSPLPEFLRAQVAVASLACILFAPENPLVPAMQLVTHQSLLHKVHALRAKIPLLPADLVLHYSTLHDLSGVQECLLTLHAGACIVWDNFPASGQSAQLEQKILDCAISVVYLPAALLHIWISNLAAAKRPLPPTLRMAIAAGKGSATLDLGVWSSLAEARVALCFAYRHPSIGVALLHAYDAAKSYRQDQSVLGQVVGNCHAYVLDEYLQPVAASCVGMLYFGGADLQASNAATVNDPFAVFFDESGPRQMVCSGEMVRRHVTGELLHIGHSERQQRRNGCRFYLDQVERLLLTLPSVVEVAARMKTDSKPQLEAFVVLQNGVAFDAAKVLSRLRRSAAAHLVPQSLQVIAHLPRRHDYSLEESNLIVQELITTVAKPVVYSAQLKALLDTLSRLLRIAQLNPADNYFSLGGDSVLLLRSIAMLYREGWSIKPSDFFESASLSELSTHMMPLAHQQNSEAALQFPLTPFHQLQLQRATAHHWNRSLLIDAASALDSSALRQSLRSLLRAHAGLRSVFVAGEGHILPFQETMLDVAFASHDLRREEQAGHLLQQNSIALQCGFDLASAPLLRLAHYQMPGQRDKLFIVVHGLLADNHAWAIIMDDLAHYYAQYAETANVPDPVNDTAYPAYLRAMQQEIETRVASGEVWHHFAQMREIVAIPRDQQGINLEASQQVLRLQLDVNASRQLLQVLPAERQLKAASVTIAAAAQALSDWSKGSLLIEIGHHGRNWFAQPPVGRTVGCFSADIPLYVPWERDYLQTENLREFESALQSLSLSALAWARLPDEKQQLLAPAVLKRLQHPEVCIDFIPAPAAQATSLFSLATTTVGQDKAADGLRSHYLNLIALVQGTQLSLECRYSAALHNVATIEALLTAWRDNIETIIDATATTFSTVTSN